MYGDLIVLIVSFWHIDACFRYTLLPFYFIVSYIVFLFLTFIFCFTYYLSVSLTIEVWGRGTLAIVYIVVVVVSISSVSISFVLPSSPLAIQPLLLFSMSLCVCRFTWCLAFYWGMLVINRRLRLHISPPVTIFGLALGHWSAVFFSYSLYISSPQHVLYWTVHV